MFRRMSAPAGAAEDPVQFDVVGVWGSGNVVADRAARLAGDAYTGWTMWDGHALFGPGRDAGVALERFPALFGFVSATTFQQRYAREPGVTCEFWAGEEVLGQGCDAACAHLAATCGERDEQLCLADCAGWPASLVACTANVTTCAEDTCPERAWQEWVDRTR